ncbi:MAG: nitroreductase [Paenibacillaceae bacterium]|nr:nitroreductase [Paenibacillaceae bacterium]
MELWEAIRGRRSIGKVKPDPVDAASIERILEAAVWAPNHHLSEPWRFIVMTGAGRGVLGRAYADVAAAEAGGARTEEELAQLRAKQETKAYRAPVVIAVAVSPAPGELPTEETAAVHAAVQNMLLAAHALGLGAIWRTGEPAYHPLMRQAFGLQEPDQIVGFVYIGYPDLTPPPANRTSFRVKTTWIDH